MPSITVDSAISDTSENPVQNKVIYSALGNKQNTLTASSINDGTIAKAIGFDSSNNLVKGAVGGGGNKAYVLIKITCQDEYTYNSVTFYLNSTSATGYPQITTYNYGADYYNVVSYYRSANDVILTTHINSSNRALKTCPLGFNSVMGIDDSNTYAHCYIFVSVSAITIASNHSIKYNGQDVSPTNNLIVLQNLNDYDVIEVKVSGGD